MKFLYWDQFPLIMIFLIFHQNDKRPQKLLYKGTEPSLITLGSSQSATTPFSESFSNRTLLAP